MADDAVDQLDGTAAHARRVLIVENAICEWESAPYDQPWHTTYDLLAKAVVQALEDEGELV